MEYFSAHRVASLKSGRRRMATLLAAAVVLMCTMIVWPGRSAQADSPDSHAIATWNLDQASSRWDGAWDLAHTHDVVALQEVSNDPPPGATLLRTVNGLVPHATGGRFRGEVVTFGRSTRSHRPRDLADVVGQCGVALARSA